MQKPPPVSANMRLQDTSDPELKAKGSTVLKEYCPAGRHAVRLKSCLTPIFKVEKRQVKNFSTFSFR